MKILSALKEENHSLKNQNEFLTIELAEAKEAVRTVMIEEVPEEKEPPVFERTYQDSIIAANYNYQIE